jgi:hypothetical protein
MGESARRNETEQPQNHSLLTLAAAESLVGFLRAAAVAAVKVVKAVGGGLLGRDDLREPRTGGLGGTGGGGKAATLAATRPDRRLCPSMVVVIRRRGSDTKNLRLRGF